jgi:hypothetical protein
MSIIRILCSTVCQLFTHSLYSTVCQLFTYYAPFPLLLWNVPDIFFAVVYHEQYGNMEKKRLRWKAEEEAGLIGNTASSGAAECVNGFAGDYACSGVDLLSFVSLADLNCHGNGNDIWGWTDEFGNEYVVAGCTDASSLVDVTDPLNPVVMGYIATQTVPSSWRDMKVHKGFAYIGSEAKDHGMQVNSTDNFWPV